MPQTLINFVVIGALFAAVAGLVWWIVGRRGSVSAAGTGEGTDPEPDEEPTGELDPEETLKIRTFVDQVAMLAVLNERKRVEDLHRNQPLPAPGPPSWLKRSPDVLIDRRRREAAERSRQRNEQQAG